MKLARLIVWLPLGFTITVVFGVLYASVQQVYRQGANDPQIQIVEDAAATIAAGADPRSVVPVEKVELTNSLAPYLMVFDKGVNLLASSVELNGQPVVPPRGVLDFVQEHGQNRVTWQPQPGVRQALVVIQGAAPRSDIIAAGRSLREIERRESDLTMMVGLGWAIAMLGSLGLHFFISRQ